MSAVVSSVFQKERTRVCRWLAQQDHLYLSPETIFITKRLLLSQPGLSAYQLFPSCLACLWLASKFVEPQHNQQHRADDFLQAVKCPCTVSVSDLLQWERWIVQSNPLFSRLSAELTLYSPLHVVTDFRRLCHFMTSNEDVQLQFLRRLRRYTKHHQPLLSPATHFLLLSLCTALSLAITFNPNATPALVSRRNKAVSLVDELNLALDSVDTADSADSDTNPMSPVQLTFCQLLTECIYLFLKSHQPPNTDLYHYTLAVKTLSHLLRLWHKRRYCLTNTDPVSDILFYRSFSSWLQHTSRDDQLALLQALRKHHNSVLQELDLAHTVSKLRLLCLELLVFFTNTTVAKVPLTATYISSTLHYRKILKQALVVKQQPDWEKQGPATKKIAEHFLLLLLSFRVKSGSEWGVKQYMKKLYSLLRHVHQEKQFDLLLARNWE